MIMKYSCRNERRER